MNSQPNPQSDRKLLLAVSGLVVAGAVGVALVAALTARDEGRPSARDTEPVRAAAALAEEPFPPEVGAPDASEPAAETVVIDPDADPWQAGLRAYGERDHATAAAYLSLDAERRPDNADTHYLLGLALWKSSRLDAAVEALERSAELDDRSIRTFVNLARIRLARGDTESALESAESALALDPRAEPALYQKARALYAMNRVDDAVAALETCLALDPAAGEAHNLLGLIHLQSGEWIAALESLEVAAALLPEVAHAQNNYGLALEHAGRFAEAVLAFRRATEADAAHAAARVSLARVEARALEAGEFPVAVATAGVEDLPSEPAAQEVARDLAAD